MNRLGMCNRLRQETGISSVDLVTTVGVSAGSLRLVNWIDQSWIELQNRKPWQWMRKTFTLPVVAGQKSYAHGDCSDDDGIVTRLKRWHFESKVNPPWIYKASSGPGSSTPLTYLSWPDFNNLFNLNNSAPGYPSFITVAPDRSIVIGPEPNDDYVITGEYMRSAQVLALDTDEPELPEEYHMLIVFMAMIDLGYYDVADEIIQRGTEKKNLYMRQLVNNQTDQVRFPGPMA